jgi:hypothetical protein
VAGSCEHGDDPSGSGPTSSGYAPQVIQCVISEVQTVTYRSALHRIIILSSRSHGLLHFHIISLVVFLNFFCP